MLNGKVALISGAAGGIGAECARVFAQNSVRAVVLLDLDEAEGRRMESELRPTCDALFIKANVADESDIVRAVDTSLGAFGRLDILANIAGICSTQTMMDTDSKCWDRIMDVNLKGTFFLSRLALRLMMDQGTGRIINMASISGQLGGIRTSPAYAVSKAGVICLTKSLAKMSAKDGVTVNAIAPGLVDTEMTRTPGFVYNISEIPMGRVAQPRDIADVALFLASDLSRYITGQCINVNGGMLM